MPGALRTDDPRLLVADVVATAGLADFPGGPARRFHLAEVGALGDIAVPYLPKLTSA